MLRLDAGVPEQPVLDILFVGVQIVQNHVRIAALARSEHHYLEMLGKFL